MFIYNNDGGQTEMCGNALRATATCIAQIDQGACDVTAIKSICSSPSIPQSVKSTASTTTTPLTTVNTTNLSRITYYNATPQVTPPLRHDVQYIASTLAGDKTAIVFKSAELDTSSQMWSLIDMQPPLLHPLDIPTTLQPNHVLFSASDPHHVYPVLLDIPTPHDLAHSVYMQYIQEHILTPLHISPAEWVASGNHSRFDTIFSTILRPHDHFRATISNTSVPHAIYFIDNSEDKLPEDCIVNLPSHLHLFTIWDVLSFFFPILGFALTTSPCFPAQINVEFVRSGLFVDAEFGGDRNVHNGNIMNNNQNTIIYESIVNERGAHITMACGSGCSAVALAAILTNRLNVVQRHNQCSAHSPENILTPLLVRMPGGDLHITWDVAITTLSDLKQSECIVENPNHYILQPILDPIQHPPVAQLLRTFPQSIFMKGPSEFIVAHHPSLIAAEACGEWGHSAPFFFSLPRTTTTGFIINPVHLYMVKLTWLFFLRISVNSFKSKY